MRKPDFFIVGAPKGGTTAMNAYLGQHPEIFIAERKELHFFGTDLDFSSPRITQEQYLSCFSEVQNEKRVGETSVWYLYSKQAAVEIKKFCPSANIIIMLRNPVDMLYSQHSQFLYNGNETISDFETALDAEVDRKRGKQIPDSVILLDGLYYRETAKFSEQVRRYLDTFGRESIFVIIFDDFKSDIATVYRDTLRFLDVNTDFQPKFEIINPNKRVRSKFVRRFLWTPATTVRWLGRALVPRKFRKGLTEGLQSLNIRYEPRQPMNPELRKRLQQEFAPQIEELSMLLGRDLTHWTKK